MASDSKYASCSVAGDGILYIEGSKKTEKFKIIDMSAVVVRIQTPLILKEGQGLRLKIRLIGGVIDVHLNVNGKVSRVIDNGYEIKFMGLSDNERQEIDELMKNTCNIE